MLASLARLDLWLFLFVNRTCANPVVDQIAPGLSELGGWTIAFVAIAALAADGRARLKRHLMVLLVFVLLVPLTSGVAKTVVNRDRPITVLRQQGEAALAEMRLLDSSPLERRSFPSGHTMLAFFFMTYAGQWKRAGRPYLLGLAGAIGVSRIYVGAHFPSDCLAGAVIGAAIGLAAWRAATKAEDRRGPP